MRIECLTTFLDGAERFEKGDLRQKWMRCLAAKSTKAIRAGQMLVLRSEEPYACPKTQSPAVRRSRA